jgi:hypothetical protein
MVDALALSTPMKGPTHREPFRPARVDCVMRGVVPPPSGWAGPTTTNGATVHSPALDPTTSFLTAAALIYAIGAGITAGAGTRLVHQLLLTDRFRYRPWQSSHGRAAWSCYFSSLPQRCVAIGQFARLLPTLVV